VPRTAARLCARAATLDVSSGGERFLQECPGKLLRPGLWVPTISSTSRDQAIFVDRATGASLSSYAVLPENDRLW
jgi:hypothetical protein